MRDDPLAQVGMTEEHLEQLVRRSCAGDKKAWADVWLVLAPWVERVAGQWRVTSRLSRSMDERRNIALRVMGELREDGFRRLAELGERLAARDGSYRPWFATVATNSALKYVRQHPDYLAPIAGAPPGWVRQLPLHDQLEADGFDLVTVIDAPRILSRAREKLAPAQLEALCRWLRGEGASATAAALHLEGGAPAAARLVHAALARLRFHHAADASDVFEAEKKSTGESDGRVEKRVHGETGAQAAPARGRRRKRDRESR